MPVASGVPPSCASVADSGSPAPTEAAADASSPFEPGAGVLRVERAGPRPADSLWCGPVAFVEPLADGHRVALAPTDAAERAFTLRLPANVPLPFAIDDVISVRLRTERAGLRWVTNATIASRDGRLLVGYSENGSVEAVPGWGLSRGPAEGPGAPPATGAAEQRTHGVLLAHDGLVARVASRSWRQLKTSDGAWATTGSAHSWTAGVLPPDAWSGTTFGVVRLCERPGCR